MKEICRAALFTLFFATTSQSGEAADSNSAENCLLPANLKDKGFKCDSVGDFGSDRKSFPNQSIVIQPGANKELNGSIGKELTIHGFIVSKDNPEPLVWATKSGDHGQVFRLINCKEVFPQWTSLEVTGKLQVSPNNNAGTPVHHYFFDCQRSKIRQIEKPLK